MKVTFRRFSGNFGFTLIEMMVTVGVIAILLGLLVPALTMVRKMAATVKQKAQFVAIEIALEAFNAEAKKSFAPSGRSLPGSTHLLSDFDILHAAGGQQHDRCPLGESH